jgi:hypothetical protein
MPKGSKPNAARPTPKEPTSTPSVGKPLDLSAYRSAAPTPAPTRGQREPRNSTEQAERELRTKVSWDQLAGIDGLKIVDGWEDTDDEYGDYSGTIVRLPARGNAASMDVLALTSSSTRAGKALHAKHVAGVLGAQVGDGSDAVNVTVRAKRSPLHPDGRPMVILTFG